jgi:hypothetical protein
MSEAWAANVGDYEKSLKKFGPTPCGVGWTNGADLAARGAVELDLSARGWARPLQCPHPRASNFVARHLGRHGIADSRALLGRERAPLPWKG